MRTTISLVNDLLAHADNRESYHHGEKHWRGVAQAGWYLAAADPRVDLDALFLFAVLHDSRRENEFDDPDHGSRAASRLWNPADPASDVWPGPTKSELATALHIHNGAHPSEVANATVAACLDADRLNLWRVGKRPNPDLLCTVYGRRPEVIEWALRLCDGYCPRWKVRLDRKPVPLLSWEQLLAAYESLARHRHALAGAVTARSHAARKMHLFGNRYGFSQHESRLRHLFAR